MNSFPAIQLCKPIIVDYYFSKLNNQPLTREYFVYSDLIASNDLLSQRAHMIQAHNK